MRLEPLTEEHYGDLFAAIARPEVFAGGYGGGPAGLPTDAANFRAFADAYYNRERNNPYVVRLVGGPADGLVVGTSTLGDFDEPNEATHRGWTAYAPEVWRTAVNAETKLLLLGLAFDSGFGRVKIQADVLNERSRAAIAGIGATFEGIVRRDKRRADGSWRDAAVFSVIVDDWPRVRAGLEKRLAAASGPVVPRPR
ncbi:GNAT family N-acetyltransferase [Herbiconiux sp. SYSU D00978]|uniref:GNAT family N-acetyltransferase n=1 Tax=Herbiconiux sp. SYSU D00978 TaxID=2812562 RepID=UPI0027DE577A|nr:GNAT family protein [Herbiconiux sp. SYSU D00978]